MLLNALKTLAGIPDEVKLIAERVIEPIQRLKVTSLHNRNPRLHTDEVLIALAICAVDDEFAARAIAQLPRLKGLEAHASVLPLARGRGHVPPPRGEPHLSTQARNAAAVLPLTAAPDGRPRADRGFVFENAPRGQTLHDTFRKEVFVCALMNACCATSNSTPPPTPPARAAPARKNCWRWPKRWRRNCSASALMTPMWTRTAMSTPRCPPIAGGSPPSASSPTWTRWTWCPPRASRPFFCLTMAAPSR